MENRASVILFGAQRPPSWDSRLEKILENCGVQFYWTTDVKDAKREFRSHPNPFILAPTDRELHELRSAKKLVSSRAYRMDIFLQMLHKQPTKLGAILSNPTFRAFEELLEHVQQCYFEQHSRSALSASPEAWQDLIAGNLPDEKPTLPKRRVETPPEEPVPPKPIRKLTAMERAVVHLERRFADISPIPQIERFRQKHSRAIDVVTLLLFLVISMFGASKMTAKEASVYMSESLANSIYNK